MKKAHGEPRKQLGEPRIHGEHGETQRRVTGRLGDLWDRGNLEGIIVSRGHKAWGAQGAQES